MIECQSPVSSSTDIHALVLPLCIKFSLQAACVMAWV
jgi:hypothetical protein